MLFPLPTPGALCAQTLPGTLRGQVTDPSGAVIPGAVVTLIRSSGKTISLKTNNEGSYSVKGLPAGKYTVRASAKGFTPFENREVIVSSGQEKTLDIPLVIAPIEEQEVVVSDQPTVDVDSTNNVVAVVLKGSDLDMLSDDPEDLFLKRQEQEDHYDRDTDFNPFTYRLN